MTVADFASKIKQKYPAYKDIPDQELATKVISKFPQYKDQVIMTAQRPDSAAQFQQAREQGAYSEPSERSGKPVTYLVQKPGENYLDFMKRAAAHGKTVSQEQIKDEALQPKKAVRALGRGAEAGVVGAAGLAGAGEAGAASGPAYNALIRQIAGNVLPGMEGEAAKQVVMKAVPKIIDGMMKLGMLTGGAAYAWKTLSGGK
jgi:hypothetical protein